MIQISASVGDGGVNRPSDVMAIQRLLNGHQRALAPLPALKEDGAAGPKTNAAIRAFQTRVVRLARPDGRVDPGGRTLSALNAAGPSSAGRYQYITGPQELLADIARPYIGATESSGNRMGTDPRMREIFEADRYAPSGQTDGYPWCCAFVSMCVQKLIARSLFFASIRPPYTPSVHEFRTTWAPSQNCLIFTPNDTTVPPHKGDVVVFTFSHIGIVETVQAASVNTIEGNTNEAGSREGTTVRRKLRPFSQVRVFIRLPIPAQYDFERGLCIA